MAFVLCYYFYMPKPRLVIAVDPGKSGGIAWGTGVTDVKVVKMPKSQKDLCDLFLSLSRGQKLRTCIEKVGPRPTDGRSTLWAFAHQVGSVETAIVAAGLVKEHVDPKVWQAPLGDLPKEYEEKKRAIKDLMQARYKDRVPKVTLLTADALGIFSWAIGVR